ncbi:hypothetical protein [Paenibacillus tyrfis]|uniref:hypothetical protein n=1 Tax=Paenibacillus tyrfis TaxID=1501230 RepID=UPI00209FD9FD|nr:hypothetical protein [Paenibacillus tyrfis]MCP1309141.1 hypothetical protein [Paenibacillus tyrfis]
MTEPVLKYAAALDLPEGKRAGYYAQIVKALAGKTALFDRDKELMIFSSPEELERLMPILEQYVIPSEELNVLLLPAPVTTYPAFGDYGFVSRLENVYLYAELVAVFRLRPATDTNGTLGRPSSRSRRKRSLRSICLQPGPSRETALPSPSKPSWPSLRKALPAPTAGLWNGFIRRNSKAQEMLE